MKLFKTPLAPVTLILALSLFGCVTPVVEKYTSFHDQRFSARTNAPEIYDGDITELMQDGYLLIGYVDFQHNIQSCHDDYTCQQISENNYTQEELLKRSARRGADKVQVLDSQLELKKDTKSTCTGYTTQSYSDGKGNTYYTTVCSGYAYNYGYMESWKKRALLWRHAPELATADKNYEAVNKAFAIFNQDKNQPAADQSAVTTNEDGPAFDDTEQKEESLDLYGQQLVTAINNDNLSFLAQEIKSPQLRSWETDNKINLLFLAYQLQRPITYSWLLKQDIPWDEKTETGYSVFDYALAYGTPADIEEFIQLRPKQAADWVNNENSYIALAYSRNPDNLEYALSKGLSINHKIAEDYTFLHLALEARNNPMTNLAIDKGADINAKTIRGKTPLMAAAQENNLEAFQRLLSLKADITAKDTHQSQAIHYAALFADAQFMEYLLTQKVDLNSSNSKKFTPIYFALLKGNWETANLLMQQDISYKMPDADSFIETIRSLIYAAPAGTLDLFLKKTHLVYVKELDKLLEQALIGCAKFCKEESMTAFLNNGVNMYYSPNDKSLFKYAYEHKNVGALTAFIRKGYRASTNSRLSHLQLAVLKGDELLVRAHRAAEKPIPAIQTSSNLKN